MTRVLHLLTALGPGGAEIWLLNMIEPLRARGFELGFVLKAPELGQLEHVAHQRGARTYHVRLSWSQHAYVRSVARIVRDEGYAIVHSHEFVYSGLSVAAARLARVPVVLTFHHFIYEGQTAFTKRVGVRHLRELYGRASVAVARASADRVTTLSRAVAERALPDWRQDIRFRPLRLSVSSLPLPTPEQRSALRASLGFREDDFVIVHVGRFIEQKNHVGILRIFERLHAKSPKARLLLVGQGPLLGEVRARVGRSSARDAVRIEGVRTDIPVVLASSDVLLFPSRDEGFGLVPLEANAAGVPVVGSKIPGLDEAVVDGETAILHSLDDEEAMAESLLALSRDPSRRAAMGGAGRERALTEFSHEASAKLLAEVYQSLAR